MIITDLSQIILAPIHVAPEAGDCARHPSEQSKQMLKHFIINSIRSYFVSHKTKYGNMVLACDSGSWRNDVFDYYKWKRKDSRKNDTSGIHWDFVFEMVSELISDIDNYFPFPVIKVPKTEGDDIIATVVKYVIENPTSTNEDIFGNAEIEPILIISSDGDNAQLHKWKQVKQISPIDKTIIKLKDKPRNLLIQKIVKGDVGDGVPNVRSADNVFKEGIRQKPISQKLLDECYVSVNPIECMPNDEMKKNYLRNELLVSYDKIPDYISEPIILEYNKQIAKKHAKMDLMNYFVKNRMNNLLGQITDFYI